MILRFQHAIADGISLVLLYKRLFGDETSKNHGDSLFNKRLPGQKSQKTSVELINQYLVSVWEVSGMKHEISMYPVVKSNKGNKSSFFTVEIFQGAHSLSKNFLRHSRPNHTRKSAATA